MSNSQYGNLGHEEFHSKNVYVFLKCYYLLSLLDPLLLLNIEAAWYYHADNVVLQSCVDDMYRGAPYICRQTVLVTIP